MLSSTFWRRVLATLLMWLISIRVLRYAFPVYMDGSGPMPSFFYRGYSPTLYEYYASKLQYDLGFLLPYAIAALVIVVICLCISPAVSSLVGASRARFLQQAAVSFALLLAAAGASDLVVRIGKIPAGIFFSGDLLLLFTHCTVAAVLAGSSAFLARVALKPFRWGRG